MKGYFFVYNKMMLARVWANNETDAREVALDTHSWCGVTSVSQFTLRKVNSTTAFG